MYASGSKYGEVGLTSVSSTMPGLSRVRGHKVTPVISKSDPYVLKSDP